MGDMDGKVKENYQFFDWEPWYAWRPVRLTHGADGRSNVMRSRPTNWTFRRHILRAKTMRAGYYSMPFISLPAYREPPSDVLGSAGAGNTVTPSVHWDASTRTSYIWGLAAGAMLAVAAVLLLVSITIAGPLAVIWSGLAMFCAVVIALHGARSNTRKSVRRGWPFIW
jgi:hypothetical protein